jgi:hypothetical protein
MKSDVGQLKLRLPNSLRRKLERASDKSGRSLNNEIVWLLTRAFGDHGAVIFAQHEAAEADEKKAQAELEKVVEGIVKSGEFRRELFKVLTNSPAFIEAVANEGKKRK